MAQFDPPSDPYGGEKLCLICGEPLEWNSLIREWECLADHDASNERPRGDFTRKIDYFIGENLGAMNSVELQKVIDECDSLTETNCSWVRYRLRELVKSLAMDMLRGIASETE